MTGGLSPNKRKRSTNTLIYRLRLKTWGVERNPGAHMGEDLY